MQVAAYYRYLKSNGCADQFLQFSCLASAHQYAPVYRLLGRYQLGHEVLDWGCGNGHFSRYLTANGITTVGYSFQDSPPALSSEPLFTHVQGGESEPVKLPFANERFGTVFSIGVLEHVWETGGSDIESLREIRRVLRRGGLFVCVHLPNERGWIERVARHMGVVEHFHQRKYTAESIAALARQADLRIEEIGTYNFLPRNQLRKLPKVLCDTRVGAALINAADSMLAACQPGRCQNYFVVMRRIDSGA